MLIEFSVSNYLSFREKQTFSMVAAPRLRKKGNTFKPEVSGEKLPDLLKVAAIYGPNASGKSNLLRAMGLISVILRRSPGEAKLPIAPFRFDKELLAKPSTFEINFVCKSLRYQFQFSATEDRIVEERLIAYPRGRVALLYERIHSNTGEQYRFGSDLEGGEDLHETWRKLTGPKTLFLAQAVANSSEDLNQLRAPHSWLTEGFTIVTNGMNRFASATQAAGKANPTFFSENIAEFLQRLDVPVVSMRFESSRAEEKDLNLSEDKPDKFVIDRNVKTTLTHRTALGEADFDFSEESDGTKGLIGFWLPWHLMSSRLDRFSVIAIDELDSSLHPEIVANLVRSHLTSDKTSQLIFTTHDTHLMDTKLLRRDQFWVVERDKNGATQLRSIHDFDGRESEDVEKRYYEGRYRGLPILRQAKNGAIN